jgi:Uma2 family endonuclease
VKLPDPSTGHYELHHGRLVQTPPRKKIHVKVRHALFDLLSPSTRGQGFLGIEFPFRPGPEYESWIADVAFVAQDRWDRDENDYFLGAPDLVIELLSESNTMDEMLDRQNVCFANGCVSFWTVDPKRRVVMITNPKGVTVTVNESSTAQMPQPLSGSIDVFRRV